MRKRRPDSFITFRTKILKTASSFNSLTRNELMNLTSSDGSNCSKTTKKKVQKSKSDISVRKRNKVVKTTTTTIKLDQIFVNPISSNKESKLKKSHRRNKKKKTSR